MKELMLICAPVSSRSGYGAHARDLVSSFIEHDKYDIKIHDVRWGNCPRNALNPKNPNDKKILDCILTEQSLNKQPEIYVDIRIPNEFETHGSRLNIGITAGIETNAVSQPWIDACNKMDLVIVPSEHAKGGFVNSIYDKFQNMPDGSQQKVGEYKLEKPMEVLFEGADENIYKPIENASLNYVDDIKEDFNYLMVGQWGKGGYGEDRKDIGRTIKIFLEAFANKENQPGLILKTQGATFSIIDREDILGKIKEIKNQFPLDWKLPNIYVLHGDLTDEEMNKLYNHPKVKCMVSFTHGEGFGRPLLEASMTGLPIMVSNWSGHLDFLDGEKTILIPGSTNVVPKSAVWENIIIPESSWFTIDEGKAYQAYNYSFANIEQGKEKAESLMKDNRNKFTLKNMVTELDNIMKKHSEKVPKQVSLNLPKLKKVGDEKQQSLKLPKLKKVTGEGVTV